MGQSRKEKANRPSPHTPRCVCHAASRNPPAIPLPLRSVPGAPSQMSGPENSSPFHLN